MGTEKKKKFGVKWLLLVALIILVVSALGAVAYFVSKNYRQLERFNDAMSAYSSEDWELAQQRLAASASEDPNNEDVVTKLATVSEKLDNWVEAGLLWSRAAELNAFKPEYVEQSLNAYLRAGEIELLRDELTAAQPFKSDRHRLLMAFVNAQTGEIKDARRLIEELTDAKSLSTPLGELVTVLADEATEITPEQAQKLESLGESTDPSVALFALYTLANDAIGKGEMTRAETYLNRRIPLNSALATKNLANFYYVQGKSESAAKLYRGLIEELTPIEAIRFAESLIALKSTDELQTLVKRYRVGSRAEILTGYYMDALLAYETGDAATVAAKLDALGDELPVTPVAQLLTFYDSVQRKDTKKIVALLTAFPYNAHERLAVYVPQIKTLVIDLMDANNLTEAAQISELLKLRDFNDATFTLAVLGNAAQKQVLSRIDLELALEAYPEEPRLWSIAADFYLRNSEFALAQHAAQQILSLVRGNISGQLQLIRALESMNHITDAAKAFDLLYDENPSEGKVLIQYLAFCARNQLSANLSALLVSLTSNPGTAPDGTVFLVEAEIALIAGQIDNMHAALMQVAEDPQLEVSPDNAAILYRVANMLATYNYVEPAIKVYRKLLALSPNAVPILVNLSELYAVLAPKQADGSAMTEALKLAKLAYAVAPQSAIVRECYAMRLYENGNYDEAQKLLLGFIQQDASASSRIRDAWKGSMEHLIQDLAAKNEIYNRSNLCKQLIHEFPKNEIASGNLQSIQKELQRRTAEAASATEESQ